MTARLARRERDPLRQNLVSALYVHVPFCARKCLYCAFYSEVARGALADRYVEALMQELALVASELKPETFFFGGGTPTILSLRQWERILEAMDRLGLLGPAEWTVECNPATLSLDKARLLRSYGVNRISLGAQTLDEALLVRLGRVHTPNMVFRSYDCLRQAGFDNINLDLMLAIPGQTLSSWRQTLCEALAMRSEHLSCYEVTFEEDTPLYEQWQMGEVSADEDLACDMYEELLQQAASGGYHQYEVSNFARHLGPPGAELPDRACRHNLNYWRGGAFYGLGPSATSYARGERTRNWADTERYCRELAEGRRAIASREVLSPLARAAETAAFGLRLTSGWAFDQFSEVTGFDLRQHWAAEMDTLIARGWGERQAHRFRLTAIGLRFADAAAEMFLR